VITTVFARTASTNDDDLTPVLREGRMAVEQQTVSTELEFPEIRAWARAELPRHSEGEIDRIIREWSRTPRTRRELYWLEGALTRLRRRAPCRVPEPGHRH
jgi:hypothetical protein